MPFLHRVRENQRKQWADLNKCTHTCLVIFVPYCLWVEMPLPRVYRTYRAYKKSDPQFYAQNRNHPRIESYLLSAQSKICRASLKIGHFLSGRERNIHQNCIVITNCTKSGTQGVKCVSHLEYVLSLEFGLR